MNKYYTEEAFEYPEDANANANANGCILKGDSWQVFLTPKGYVLEYISGELAGRLKEIYISSDDLEELKIKKITLNEILIRYSKN